MKNNLSPKLQLWRCFCTNSSAAAPLQVRSKFSPGVLHFNMKAVEDRAYHESIVISKVRAGPPVEYTPFHQAMVIVFTDTLNPSPSPSPSLNLTLFDLRTAFAGGQDRARYVQVNGQR